VASFNAAAALVAGGGAKDLNEGMTMAVKSIDSGEAARRLERLVELSNA
jgi:anthranilate phosphoribosyltransferase